MKTSDRYLQSLEEAETYLWVKQGLERLDKLLQSIDADDDLLDLIDYLKEDNEYWVNSELLADAAQSPKSLSS